MAEIAGAIIAGASLAYGVYAGETGARTQRDARRKQEAGQRTAEQQAMRQAQRADEAERKANAETPNVASLLTDSAKPRIPNLLTGPSGVDPSRLKLGSSNVLGG